jgi:peptide/nickel transport system permease protein
MLVAIRRVQAAVNFSLKNRKVAIGLSIVMVMLLVCIISWSFVDFKLTRIGAVSLTQPPSLSHLLGTDTSGRDIFALLVYGIPNTLTIGLVAGAVGTLMGIGLGLASGYYRGPLDTVIRSAADIQLMIPILVVLILIATFFRELSLGTLGVLIALFSWAWPTRTIRAQTLSLRERRFVDLARASGTSDLRIMFEELLPNMLPYIGASFVSAVSGGLLVSIAIQVIGLGPQRIPTLGMMLYWALYNAAVIRGLWWWWFPPVVVLILTFVGLFLITMGLDEIGNPRLRRA